MLHLERFQHLSGSRIHPSQVAFVALPRCVPQLAIDPCDTGDEAIGLEGAKDGAGLRIDLMDLALAVMADPQRSFGPREPESPPPAGPGIVASTRPLSGSILWMRSSAIW